MSAPLSWSKYCLLIYRIRALLLRWSSIFRDNILLLHPSCSNISSGPMFDNVLNASLYEWLSVIKYISITDPFVVSNLLMQISRARFSTTDTMVVPPSILKPSSWAAPLCSSCRRLRCRSSLRNYNSPSKSKSKWNWIDWSASSSKAVKDLPVAISFICCSLASGFIQATNFCAWWFSWLKYSSLGHRQNLRSRRSCLHKRS